jgi:hypothetical protein
MLSTHEAFFQLMFLLLDEDREVAAEVWLTLNRLPPSQAVMDRVLKLVPGDWSGIFPQKSPYRLLYSLKLIEFLLSEDAESSGQTAEHRR